MAKQGSYASANTSTYQKERINLIGSFQNRSGATATKDQRFVNCYPEAISSKLTDGKKYFLVKRPGLTEHLRPPAADAVGRGMYYWNGKLWSVFGNTVYMDGASSGTTLSTSTGSVGFVEGNTGTGVRYLFFCDGTNGYVINTSNNIRQVNATYSAWVTATNYALGNRVIPTVANGFYYEVTADAGSSGGTEPTWPTTIGDTVVDGGITWTCMNFYGNFPTPHVATPAFIDGFIFLIKKDTEDIYNSVLDDPDGWSASDFIQAEMFGDIATGLARQNNQLMVFGNNSVEFFFNAANVSGSPLGRTTAAVIQAGCPAPFSVTQNEKFVFFIAQSDSGGKTVFQVEGFAANRISIESIEKILTNEGSNIVNATAFMARTQGHFFYIINLTSRTLVYDIEEKMWHEWSSNDGSDGHARFRCSYSADNDNGRLFLQDNTNGRIYFLDPEVFQDNGTAIVMEGVTSKIDFENNNRKFMHIVTWVADQPATSSNLSFRWSDDDYRSWSNWKIVDLAERPYFVRLGAFRRRAFNFKYTDNNSLRLEAVEIEYNQGIT